jgi:hypothetical protein
LRSNTNGYGGKTHWTDSQNSDTSTPSGRELYHLQFLLQAPVRKLLDIALYVYLNGCLANEVLMFNPNGNNRSKNKPFYVVTLLQREQPTNLVDLKLNPYRRHFVWYISGAHGLCYGGSIRLTPLPPSSIRHPMSLQQRDLRIQTAGVWDDRWRKAFLNISHSVFCFRCIRNSQLLCRQLCATLCKIVLKNFVFVFMLMDVCLRVSGVSLLRQDHSLC